MQRSGGCQMKKTGRKSLSLALALAVWSSAAPGAAAAGRQAGVRIPSEPLKFGVFNARFDPSGTFRLEGDRWPTLSGGWKVEGDEVELLLTSDAPKGCEGPGRYRVRADGGRVGFDLVADDCTPRRMILDRSTWSPASEATHKPARRIVRTAFARAPGRAESGPPSVNWPSFRGRQAAGVADGQNLPDRWDAAKGENILWRTPIPGLAHSSPVVWGDKIFVTSSVSSDPNASFRPGLYGDGDASQDTSEQRWVLYAL